MRLANLAGRAAVITDRGAVDVETASGGLFAPDVAGIYERWAEFVVWARAGVDGAEAAPYEDDDLDAPSPRPRQVYGIGLNYRSHVAEAGVEVDTVPDWPPTFTKFVTSLTGPHTDLALPSNFVDWEVELVVVIGTYAKAVAESDAWSHVAGVTVGQDYSERNVQRAGPVPQFSLGKSYPGFGPTGPWLVTVDELERPDDLALECVINGETMQSSTTAHMILSVPQLVGRLSSITPLLPGDVIFTGTPAGVGMGREPMVFLKPGDRVVSTITGIGSLRQVCTG